MTNFMSGRLAQVITGVAAAGHAVGNDGTSVTDKGG